MDLNSASHRELQLLPGVGRVTAQLIIKSRPFTSVQDLLSVKSIGPVKFTAIVSQNQVYVDESTFDTTNTTSRAALINLNAASSRQLQRLRGVGPVLAQRIVEARPFHRKEDLLAVEGIGSKSYLKMQEQAHVPLDGAALQQGIQNEDGNVEDCRSEVEEQQFYFCREIERDVRGSVFPTRGRGDGGNRALIVGSWNIRNISRRKETFLLQRIADVLSEFDLVALQEVRDLIVLKKLKTMLPGWNYVVSSPVGSKVTGAKARRSERYAFFFRRCMVRLVDKCSLIEDKNDVLARLPCIATFRATRQSGVSDLELSLMNVHVSFGETARRRDEIAEINLLANEMSVSARGARKIVVLGDFNLSLQDVLGRLGSDKMALIRSPLSTTVFGKLYDNIWLDRNDFSGPQVYDGEQRYRVASGVLRVDWQYYPFSKGSRHRLQGSVDTMRPQLKTYMSRVQCGYELSDHCPVWVAFAASACYDAVDGKAMSEPK